MLPWEILKRSRCDRSRLKLVSWHLCRLFSLEVSFLRFYDSSFYCDDQVDQKRDEIVQELLCNIDYVLNSISTSGKDMLKSPSKDNRGKVMDPADSCCMKKNIGTGEP